MKQPSKVFLVIVGAPFAAQVLAGAATKNGFDLSKAAVPVEEILSGGPAARWNSCDR